MLRIKLIHVSKRDQGATSQAQNDTDFMEWQKAIHNIVFTSPC